MISVSNNATVAVALPSMFFELLQSLDLFHELVCIKEDSKNAKDKWDDLAGQMLCSFIFFYIGPKV